MMEQQANIRKATPRSQVEWEVDEDLKKDYRHLLIDAHEELLHWDWSPEERVIHAQKRLASLQVQVAKSADKQADEIRRLTVSMNRLTVLMFLIAITTLIVTIMKP